MGSGRPTIAPPTDLLFLRWTLLGPSSLLPGLLSASCREPECVVNRRALPSRVFDPGSTTATSALFPNRGKTFRTPTIAREHGCGSVGVHQRPGRALGMRYLAVEMTHIIASFWETRVQEAAHVANVRPSWGGVLGKSLSGVHKCSLFGTQRIQRVEAGRRTVVFGAASTETRRHVTGARARA